MSRLLVGRLALCLKEIVLDSVPHVLHDRLRRHPLSRENNVPSADHAPTFAVERRKNVKSLAVQQRKCFLFVQLRLTELMGV